MNSSIDVQERAAQLHRLNAVMRAPCQVLRRLILRNPLQSRPADHLSNAQALACDKSGCTGPYTPPSLVISTTNVLYQIKGKVQTLSALDFEEITSICLTVLEQTPARMFKNTRCSRTKSC